MKRVWRTLGSAKIFEKSAERRRRQAAKTLGQSLSKFRDPEGKERPFLVHIADTVISLNEDGPIPEPVADVGAGQEKPFIARPALDEAYDELWQPRSWRKTETGQRICVVGDAGTGKTRYIQERTAHEHPVWIDAQIDETMLPAMVELLGRYDEDVARDHPSLIRRTFGDLLGREDGPALVVLDNVADPETLDQFIPRCTHSRVIVISRRHPRHDWAPRLRIDDMSDSEAEAMVAWFLPDSSVQEHQQLALAFDRRPRIIEHGCEFLRHERTRDIEAFCDALGRDTTRVLQGVADRTDRALTAIYRRYIEQLSREAPESLEILELLAYLPHICVPREYLMAYLLNEPYIRTEKALHAELAYKAAVRPLRDLSLVQEGLFGVRMNLLVQNILRQVFADRLPHIMARVLDSGLMEVSNEKLFEAGWFIPTVVGRNVCDEVLRAHWSVFTDTENSRRWSGNPGDARWNLLVSRLWQRYLGFEILKMYCSQRFPKTQDGGIDWAKLLESSRNLPMVQHIEVVLCIHHIQSRLAPFSQLDIAREGLREEIVYLALSSFLSLFQPHESVSIGELDFGLSGLASVDLARFADDVRSLCEYLPRGKSEQIWKMYERACASTGTSTN